MSKVTELAMELKKRNNVKVIGSILGTVLSVNPLKIGILNNEAILDKCILTRTFKALLDTNVIIVQDTVLLVADDTGQVYFAIDKVVV